MPFRFYAHLSWTTWARLPLIDEQVAHFLGPFLLAEAKRHGALTVTATPPAEDFAGKRATTFGRWGSGSWRVSPHTFVTRNGSTGRRALRDDEPFRARVFAETPAGPTGIF